MPKSLDAAKPWERQLRESSQAYEAFSIYRDMGSDRSLRAVAKQLNKILTIIGRWSGAWEWVERIRAHENDLARQAREQAAREVKEMQKRQTKIAMLLQKKAVEALEKVDPEKLDESAIVRFITEGTKLERSNRMEEAGIVPVNPFGVPQKAVGEGDLDWTKISSDDLEKLARLGDDEDGE